MSTKDRPAGTSARAGGRERLLDAAERLMVDQGIDRTSLREIQAASGHKNTGAVHYHFGDRDGLIEAILLRHQPEADRRRIELLDELEANPEDATIRALMRTMLLPLFGHLATESGRRYLRLIQQGLDRPATSRAMVEGATRAPGLDRARLRMAERLTHLPPEVLVTRAAFCARLITQALADRAREIDELPGAPLMSNTATLEVLLDALVSILEAPISADARHALTGDAETAAPNT